MGGVLTNFVLFLTEQRLCQKNSFILTNYVAVCFPNLRESFCGRFRGGFISGQTESGNPWGSTEKRKSNTEIRSRKSKIIFVVRGLVGKTAR